MVEHSISPVEVISAAAPAQPARRAYPWQRLRSKRSQPAVRALPALGRPPRAGVLSMPETRGPLLEQLRLSHSRLLAALAADQHIVIAVASAREGEGKTTVAVALAEILASEFPRQLLLIDANRQRPDVHQLLDLQRTPGMTDCLQVGSLTRGAIQWSGSHWVMAAGSPPSADDGLTWDGQRGFLRTLRALFKVTIIDMPAVLTHARDAALLSRWADEVVFVVEADKSARDQVAEAIDIVGRDKLLGVVLNKHRSRLPHWLQGLL